MTRDTPADSAFEGFDATRYDAEARERWPQQWASSTRYTDSLGPAGTERLQREMTAGMQRMAGHLAAGTDPGEAPVQDEVDAAYRLVCRMWTPDAEAFRNLGRMYVEDPRFTATYDAVAPGLAAYTRDAMAAYADTRLAG